MPDHPVDVVENLWIPLADGTRLAARLWRPAGAAPVPAMLEYIPYRKRDGTRGRDEPMHGFFAARGFAAIRVDMRGSGDSDGFLDDEYVALEQDDAVEAIGWIAAQPWCSGAVGMMGKSWGGFNALQVAARRPPALKAIITVCSTDDRFGDDIHFMGGCLLNDNLWWGSIMLGYQGRPPAARAGASNGSRASTTCRSGRRSGSSISAATPTGGMGRSARTGARSSARSWSWAAGPTPIPTRFPASSNISRRRASASSGRGRMSTRRMGRRGRRSISLARRRAGGTIG